MIIADHDTEMLVDLIRSPTSSRADVLSLLDALCRAAHSEGVIAGSRSTSDLVNKTFDAVMGVRA